jgi:hypothetical protein
MWVWHYRSKYLMAINTNNGIEAQNKVLKYDYLASFKTKSISSLMHCLVEEFLDDSFRRFEYKHRIKKKH